MMNNNLKMIILIIIKIIPLINNKMIIKIIINLNLVLTMVIIHNPNKFII